MQPSMQKMDIEHDSFPKEYFASHIVQKQGHELVSKDAAAPQNAPWRTAILGRAVQRYWQDDTSPDALNGIFQEKFEALLGTYFRNDQAEELNQLKGRLTHLIDNAKAFEEFKREIFSKAWVTPVGLTSLEPLIQQAESRKQQVAAYLATLQESKDSPRYNWQNRNSDEGNTMKMKKKFALLAGLALALGLAIFFGQQRFLSRTDGMGRKNGCE